MFYDALFNYAQHRVSYLLKRIEKVMAERQAFGERMTPEESTMLRKAKMNVIVLLLRLRQASCHPVRDIIFNYFFNGFSVFF